MPKARGAASEQGMYADATMRRNLSHGNIAEAMFRLWFERHCAHLRRTHLVQLGYNPLGTVPVASKSWLPENSDPDFGLATTGAEGDSKVVLGISVNAQQALYYIGSTAGGYCSIDLLEQTAQGRRRPCPNIFDCHDGLADKGRLWYNEWNIKNDYPRFESKAGARDTVLVTLLTKRPAQVAAWLKRLRDGNVADGDRMEQAIWVYLRQGAGPAPSQDVAEFLRYLEYSNRRQPVLADFGLRWTLLSEVAGGRIERWLTASAMFDRGTPPKKYCVPESASGQEAGLVQLLERVDSSG